ncbi:MAG TPA: dihydroorotase [Candidatus Methanoperedens sp.]|nr:dihydroorotase [Candidatus Methanoperedens sp.]
MSAVGQVVVRGGRLIDPAAGIDRVSDLLLAGGRVAALAEAALPQAAGAEVIDARGLWVLPGLIDLHAHLREPGHEYKETVLTGTRAAVAGGFTAVACMPNTVPANDSAAVTRAILRKAAEAGLARVYPIGCITAGQRGERMAEYGDLVGAGCRAFSDDGRPVMDAGVMRRALEYSRHFDVAVISHCEDLHLAGDGVAHEGAVATRLGLKPIPAAAEEAMVAREVVLARQTGARVHIAHVSAAGSVAIIAAAKAEGLAVTAEATPHHFTLTDEALAGYDTATKVNPPLRPLADRTAVRRGLAEGIIDAIATDHAPHGTIDKELEFDAAASGMIGLETALPLALRLVAAGEVSLHRVVEALTWRPARILGVPGGRLAPGDPADVTLVDPEEEWPVEPDRFFSKSRNTPFAGWRLKGRVRATIVGGRVVFRDGAVIAVER